MGYSLAPGGKRLSRRTELHANRISKASEEAEYPTLVDITARLAVAEAEVGAVALLPPASLRAKSSAHAPEQDRSDVGRAHQARFDGQVDLFSGFLLAMGAGVMMVFAVLVLLFGSFLHPLTILFSLPLSIGGGILGLLIMHMPISMPVVIGILVLMGLVTKNAIRLVNFTLNEMRAGTDPASAIVEAERKRARPIVITTIAVAASMVPSAMAIGVGGEFRAPMAVAVISELIVSTLLSLVFAPTVFQLMNGLECSFGRRLGRLVGARDEVAVVPAPRQAPVHAVPDLAWPAAALPAPPIF